MSPERQSADTFNPQRAATETVTCPSCRAEMVRGMRFCRLCGFRLGEGLAEYVETVRLNSLRPTAPHDAPGGSPLAPSGGGAPLAAPAAAPPAPLMGHGTCRPRRKRAHWIVWPLLGIAIAGVSGGGAIVGRLGGLGPRINAGSPAAPRSFLGGGDFTYVGGEGLMIKAVLPGSPAELAGLRDGDIIKTLDGKAIGGEDDLRRVLRATPVGKTVAVEFVRDGEALRTMLVTIAADAYDARAFVPPGGNGYWGVSNLRRVRVPGTNIHGVRLGSVRANRPADIAGLREDDIVVEFDGRPVRTAEGLSSYIDHAAPGTIARVVVFRDGQRVEIPVKMGKE